VTPEVSSAPEVSASGSVTGGPLDAAIARAQAALLGLQDPSGYWCGELEADTTLESDTITFWHFLGRVEPVRERKLAAYLLNKQLPDGGWGIYEGGPAELNATVKAYVALKLAGHRADEPVLQRARQVILRLGGLGKVNSFEKISLAMFGQYPWSQVPALPPELLLLPRWCPFNIYEVSAWSRTILVPLTVIYGTRPSVPVPPGCGLDELWPDPRRRRSVVTTRQAGGWRRFFLAADAFLKAWERWGWKPARRRALRTAEAWLLDRLVDADGLGAIYPAMINAVFALKALGYEDGDPILERSIGEVSRLEISDGTTTRLQPCFSAVWDTAIAAYALAASGVPADAQALARANRWLRAREIRRYGDWSVKNPSAAPGGWSFQFMNVPYPDVDDTAMVALALDRTRPADPGATERAIRRGIAWILSMQNRDGGWSSFDKDNDCQALTHVPFADHNAMLDPSACDITGRVLELLGRCGYTGRDLPVRRAVAFLRRRQEPDGTWFGRWGVNYLYGTWLAARGLAAVGESLETPGDRRAVAWLLGHQNPDGGWGETIATYEDPSLAGQGPSTAAQTAWALMGLLALGQGRCLAVQRGVDYLLKTQQADRGTHPVDGSWTDRWWTGTGFPRVFYLHYHLYSVYFPLLALSQVRRAWGPGRAVPG